MSESVIAEQTVQGRIIQTKGDGEAIVFEVEMGLMKFVAIANIPEEGVGTAPVYIKIRPAGAMAPKKFQGKNRHRRGNNPNRPEQKNPVQV